MKLKSWQLSLGSLFLATLTFGLGLTSGLLFNVHEQEHQARESELQMNLEFMRAEKITAETVNYLLEKRLAVEDQRVLDIEKRHAAELQRLKDERGE